MGKSFSSIDMLRPTSGTTEKLSIELRVVVPTLHIVWGINPEHFVGSHIYVDMSQALHTLNESIDYN